MQKVQSDQIFVEYKQNNNKRSYVLGAVSLNSDFQD